MWNTRGLRGINGVTVQLAGLESTGAELLARDDWWVRATGAVETD